MKRYLHIIIFFLLAGTHTEINAQLDAFSDEVTYKDNLLYFQNKSFTGTLYSNDEEVINNPCQCTLKAFYSNGKLHGLKQEWYRNGKLKFTGEYYKNTPVKTHKFYTEKGQIEKETNYINPTNYTVLSYHNNGNLKSKTIFENSKKQGLEEFFSKDNELEIEKLYQNGKIVSKLVYQRGKKQKEEKFTETHLIIKLYHQNGIIKQEKSITKANKIKDGVWNDYDDNGNLIFTEEYENNRLKSSGSYKNNKKTGEWMSYSPDFSKKTVKTYQEGLCISTRVINTENFIKNQELHADDKIIYFYNESLKKPVYYIVRKPQDTNSENEHILKIIQQQLLSRTRLITNLEENENKELNGIIEIENISVAYQKSVNNRQKIVDGVKKNYTEDSYEAVIRYTITLKDLSGEPLKSISHRINPQSKLGLSILNTVAATYAKNPKEAFTRSLKGIHIYKFLATTFPIQAQIKEIKSESSTKVKKVIIDKGANANILKKMYFMVLDGTSNTKQKVKLKVTKVFSNTAECKVLSNQNWLKTHLQSHKGVKIIEIYK